MRPGDAGHPVTVHTIVDDQHGPGRRHRGGNHGFDPGGPRAGQQDRAECLTAPSQMDQSIPDAAHDVEILWLAVAEVRHHQSLAHGRAGVGRPGIQQDPLAHGLSWRRRWPAVGI